MYSQNLTSYTTQLEDTVWCNDRSIALNSSGNGVGNSDTIYSARDRTIFHAPTLNCTNENDRFTVNQKNGNGKLTYPVALLTVDEIMYSGFLNNHELSSSSYLFNNYGWWTLSPYQFSIGSRQLIAHSNAHIDNYLVNESKAGVRPAISLKAGTTAISGDGTATNPYVIE